MEQDSSKKKINFMGLRLPFVVASLCLIGFSFYIWNHIGIEKYSVDFLGGTEVVVKFKDPTNTGAVRNALNEAGISGAIVQSFEEGVNDFSIRLKGTGSDKNTGKLIREGLKKLSPNTFELLKQDYVGPIIGDKIRSDGLSAMIIALVCILLYISFRFEWRFAVGAIAALVHDVIITSGIFVFSGRELSAAVLAALLTIIGYSLNDTIIVFDRIRENLAESQKKSGKKKSSDTEKSLSEYGLVELINLSINQTLSRTLLTSLTTLFVVATLWKFGGGAVADLAYALVIGVVVGTYSSIFVACTSIIALAKRAKS
jgi:preprotein translocase subunit SecF